MGLGQALADLPAARRAEIFIRAPSSGRETLGRADKVKAILRCAQMLLAAQHKPRLHGAAHRVHMAVGMLAGEYILTRGKGIPVPVIRQEPDG